MNLQDLFENQNCPHCGGPAFSDLILAEKKDACYNKVRSRYKVWPSAYASGALVQCRKKGAANWGNKSKNEDVAEDRSWCGVCGQSPCNCTHIAEGEMSPMAKDARHADRVRSLKNLIAIAREQSRQLRVQELELELKKLQGLNEFAPDAGSNGDEEETLLKYARMWYNGDLETQQQVEQILDRMGWEIGELESEEGGAFVMRAGDEDGDSYIGFARQDLAEDDNFLKPAGMMKASPQALKTAQDIVQQQADRNVIGQAKIAGAVPSQGVGEGSSEKIAGRHDPDEFDAMVSRLKKLAGAGPLKTVYDPNTRRYKNVPTAVQPKQQPNK